MKGLISLLCVLFLLTGCSSSYTVIAKAKDVIIVTNQKDGSLSFIERSSSKLLAAWPLKKAIMGAVVLPDGDQLAVYGKDLEFVYVYSLSKGKEVARWHTGKGITNMLVSSTGKELLLTDQQTNTVRMYDVKGRELVAIEVGKRPMTMVESNGQLYVVNFNDTEVSVINLQKKEVVSTFTVPLSSIGAVLANNELWIGGHGSGAEINEAIYIYENGTLKQKLGAPQMPVSLAKDKTYVYVLSHGSSTLRKIHALTYEELAQVEVGSNPFSILLSGKIVFVASYDSNEIYKVNADTMEIEESIQVGEGPFQMIERKGERRS